MTKISTGSFDLNDWLQGGYESGIITMIVGPSGSGKTNFSILAACSQAREKKVIYIDTEGGFSVERVKQIVGELHLEKVLENLLILSPTTFEEQKKSFKKLLEHVKKEHVGLIVVDSIVMLYRLELGDAAQSGDEERIKQVNREVAKQMRDLVEIARKQDIPIVVTNQVYESFLSQEEIENNVEKQTKIVGGDLFQYWSKCIIELKKKFIGRKAILKKHRSLSEREISFEIKNEGIFRKKLF